MSTWTRKYHGATAALNALRTEEGLPALSEGATLRLAANAENLEEALAKIARDADRLLSAMRLAADIDDPNGLASVIRDIAHSAGASGPIGSTYEKALATAVESAAILTYA